MRSLYLLACAFLAYLALRAILRWLLRRGKDAAVGEMVRDPLCKVYVVKDQAVKRRLRGETFYFCGEDCAAKYALERR